MCWLDEFLPDVFVDLQIEVVGVFFLACQSLLDAAFREEVDYMAKVNSTDAFALLLYSAQMQACTVFKKQNEEIAPVGFGMFWSSPRDDT